MAKDEGRCGGLCQKLRHHEEDTGEAPGFLQQVADPHQPWEEIAIDFIIELPDSRGNTVIWTMIDLFLKQAHFTRLLRVTLRKLAKMFIKQVYRLHSMPRRVISDCGVQFTAKFWRPFLRSTL